MTAKCAKMQTCVIVSTLGPILVGGPFYAFTRRRFIIVEEMMHLCGYFTRARFIIVGEMMMHLCGHIANT
jgi:hypothetical protein